MGIKKALQKLFIFSGGLASMSIALFAVFAQPAAAADYTITITDNNVAKNQNVIYHYPNIGPGFSSNANINIINNASQTIEVKLLSVRQDPTDQNKMLPYVQLSLSENGTALGRGTFDSDTLIGASTCIDPRFSKQLQTHFLLPASVGNEAQSTSMRVIYTFLVTQTPCGIVAPPNAGSPNSLPPTGETMWPFWILGGITMTFFGLAILFMILVIIKRRDSDDHQPVAHKIPITYVKS